MKKTLKTLLLTLTAVGMFALTNPTTVKAETVPDKVRVYYNNPSVQIELDHFDDRIDNLKINDKKAVVMVDSIDADLDTYDNEKKETNKQDISMYLPKKGTYKITFDIVDKKGKKKSSKKINVYYYESPITIKVNGKNVYDIDLVNGKTGKVTVSLTKGNKIKKCEYGVIKQSKETRDGGYSKNSTYEYKTFKSGNKIKFNTKPQTHETSTSYTYASYYYMYTDMFAYTPIRITYIDKYTGREEVYDNGYWIRMLVAK